MNLLQTAISAAIDAGDEIMKIYHSGDFEIDMKSDDSPLTKADIASNNKIIEYLSKTGIPVLSEEGRDIQFEERRNWNRLWIVDPLDGTKEFIKKNGEFTVNIALIENQIPILGVVYSPALNELYYASKDEGSFKVLTDENKISVDDLMSSSESLPFEIEKESYRVVASRSHMSPETADYIKELESKHAHVETISRGSSLKLCMVAEGIADCYPRFAPTMEWDTAAGQAICMYAGAKVIAWESGLPMIYNRENLLNGWFLVSRN